MTLLREWRAGPWSKTPVACISLDTGDNDPLRFFQNLLAALDTLQPGIVKEIHPFLQTSEKLNYDAILILLVNALGSFTQDFTLVQDDYHVIQTLAVHETLTFILDNLPPRMYLVLLTRTDSSLPLAYLRAQDQLKRLLCSFLIIIRSVSSHRDTNSDGNIYKISPNFSSIMPFSTIPRRSTQIISTI